jgi:hypothetical protein
MHRTSFFFSCHQAVLNSPKESEELALAYGNRSAALYRIGSYQVNIRCLLFCHWFKQRFRGIHIWSICWTISEFLRWILLEFGQIFTIVWHEEHNLNSTIQRKGRAVVFTRVSALESLLG